MTLHFFQARNAPSSWLSRGRWIALLLTALSANGLAGGPLSPTPWVAGGGGQSSGGSWVLTGTIGQPVVGAVHGGDFALESGFWSTILVVPTPGGPSLSIQPTQDSIILSWTSTPAGYVLEQSTVLGTSWSPMTSGDSTSVELPLTGTARFFRLTRP